MSIIRSQELNFARYLIDENPLTVLPSLAVILGSLEKAVILQQIHYMSTWPNSGKDIDGLHYVWGTYDDLHEKFFPFMSPRTIGKHIRELEKDDYLRSIRPRQSEWDSTKFYRVNYVKINATQWSSVEDTQTGTIEDDQSGTLITEVSTEETTTSSEFGEICAVYESNIGLLTPMIGDQIKDALKDYPATWIIEGIQEAVNSEARSFRYVLGCLKNWKRDGKSTSEKKEGTNQAPIEVRGVGGEHAQ